MKPKTVSFILSSVLLISASVPCFGQKIDKHRAMTVEQLSATVARARANDKRLIVELKNGSSISGTVDEITNHGFIIKQGGEWSGIGASVPVEYADVVSVKGRNPLVKLLKNVGVYSLTTAALAAAIPLYVIAALLGGVSEC